jgi:hypothetical protein
VGDAFDFPPGGYVAVPDSPVLDPTNSITVEAWINQQSQLGPYDPVVKKAGVGGGYSVEFDGTGVPTFWVNISAVGWCGTWGGSVLTNQWTHLAGTYDGTALSIYVNGVPVSSVGLNGALVPSTSPLNIGRDPSNIGRLFHGLIDEVSIYSRALSAGEIAAIYAAGAAGKCKPSPPPAIFTQPTNETARGGATANFIIAATGSQPLTYQWLFNGTNIAATTNYSLTINKAQPSNAGGYSVVVTNAYGSVTSAVATLAVATPPAIATEPTNQTLPAGNTANFGVIVAGTGPFSYQWLLNGINLTDNAQITGSQSNVLTLTSVTAANSGTYGVVVTNAYGSTNATATLTVITPPFIQGAQQSATSFTFTWSALSNQTYQIQSTASLAPVSWTNTGGTITATNSTMTTSELIGFNSQQFYRVVLLP